MKKGKAPPSGQKADLQIRDEFVFLMERNFPWLRFCENHWKSDQLWSNHYPNWHKRVMEAKEEAKAKASAEATKVIDVDSDNASIADVQTNLKRHRADDEMSEPKCC